MEAYFLDADMLVDIVQKKHEGYDADSYEQKYDLGFI